MIKLVKMECPSCGGTLEKKRFRGYKCSYCNSRYVLDVDVIVPVPEKKQKSTAGSQNRISNASKDDTAFQNKIALAVCGVFLLMLVIGIIIGINSNNSKPKPQIGNKETASNATETNKGIQSAFFKEFVKTVFGKDAEQVTEEERGEITYISMQNKGNIVEYKRNDGELLTAILPKDLVIQYEDLRYFPELKVLIWDAYKDRNEVIRYLPKLEEFTCSISPALVLKYIPNPSQLKKLSCKYYEDGEGVGELDRFDNLTDLSLTIHISGASKAKAPDLNSISKLTKLEHFYLDNDEYLTVSYLSDLTNLKSVNLHCDSLKDLNFINKLADLEELTLVKCDILSVENLKYTPKLKVLRLKDCYQVDSYEPVAKLEQLEELMLSYSYGQILPESFSKLNKVTKLTLESFKDISFLSDFPNVTSLQMFGCNYLDFEKLSCMKKLQELKLSSGYNLMNLSVLCELKELQKVDMSGMGNSANTEILFKIPNIKELNLNDTEFTIDLNVIEKNESLEELYLENLKWSAFNTQEGNHKYNYENWERLPMNECITFLENFPSLKKLSIQGNKVDSLAFTKALPKLQWLDITNNYIDDIQLLNELPDLTEVRCGENPLSSDTNLDSRITVDAETKATERWPFWHYDW